ncbi:hypothetical protein HOY82DRAFT_100256 [Tuber indicum]|nr:hypothetical protein HOY82DRAFT_100256 [Tuber indicum]
MESRASWPNEMLVSGRWRKKYSGGGSAPGCCRKSKNRECTADRYITMVARGGIRLSPKITRLYNLHQIVATGLIIPSKVVSNSRKPLRQLTLYGDIYGSRVCSIKSPEQSQTSDVSYAHPLPPTENALILTPPPPFYGPSFDISKKFTQARGSLTKVKSCRICSVFAISLAPGWVGGVRTGKVGKYWDDVRGWAQCSARAF